VSGAGAIEGGGTGGGAGGGVGPEGTQRRHPRRLVVDRQRRLLAHEFGDPAAVAAQDRQSIGHRLDHRHRARVIAARWREQDSRPTTLARQPLAREAAEERHIGTGGERAQALLLRPGAGDPQRDAGLTCHADRDVEALLLDEPSGCQRVGPVHRVRARRDRSHRVGQDRHPLAWNSELGQTPRQRAAHGDEPVGVGEQPRLLAREPGGVHRSLRKRAATAVAHARHGVAPMAAVARLAVAERDPDRTHEPVVVQVQDGARASRPCRRERTPAEQRVDVVRVYDIRPMKPRGLRDVAGVDTAAQQSTCCLRARGDLAVAFQACHSVPPRAQQRLQLLDDAFLAAGGAVAVMQQQHTQMPVGVARREQARRSHRPPILARCPAVAIALVTNVLAPYRVPLYALLAERYGVEVLCFGAGASYVPAWFGDLDAQLEAAPFPARRIGGPREALGLGKRYDAAIAPVAGGAMLPASYLGMHVRGKPFVLWGSVWAHPRGGMKAALAFPLVRHVYRHADAVVTYGEHVRRYVTRYRGRTDNDDVVIAPQSVEAELFGCAVSAEEIAAWRAEAGLPDGPLVLYVGRLVEEKGIEDLLAAWLLLTTGLAPLDAARPSPPPTLVAIGDGPLADDVKATPHARLLGPLARERLPVAYAAADALVLPSIPTARFREPWGLVCNEAFHQRTPVIATTAVGAVAGGLVRDGETGLVVPPSDPPALARAIERLLDDAALRTSLGAAGRDVLAGHTYAAMADAFGVALARAGAL